MTMKQEGGRESRPHKRVGCVRAEREREREGRWTWNNVVGTALLLVYVERMAAFVTKTADATLS